MSAYLGDIAPSQVLYFAWNSNGADGASITRATNGTVSVYKDDGTTQSTTGVTDTEDFDSLTGVHWVKIDTSADGTFYASGHDFTVVLSGATIDGKTVNAVLGFFSINNRTALRPATAGRTVVVDASGLVDANTVKIGPSGSGTAQTAKDVGSINLSSGKVLIQGTIDQFDDFVDAAGKVLLQGTQTFNVTGNITGNLSGSVGSVSGAVGSVTGAVGSVTGNVGGNVTGSVGSVAAGGIASTSFAAGAIDASAIAADAIGSSELAASAANEIADAILDRATAIEGYTPRQAFRLILSALAAKLSGAATTTVTIRDITDTKDRITATVDSNGNRTAVTLDAT